MITRSLLDAVDHREGPSSNLERRIGMAMLEAGTRRYHPGANPSRCQAWPNKRIFSKWLACWTQEEIAESEDIHQDTVSEVSRNFTNLEKSDKSRKTLAIFAEPEWKPILKGIF